MIGGLERLLALDVDRTLLTDDYRVLPQVRDAIAHARSRGVIVTLATARGPKAVEHVLAQLGEVDIAICFGGALTLKRTDSGWSRDDAPSCKVIAPDDVRHVIAEARKAEICIGLYSETHVYVDAVDDCLAREFDHTGDVFRVMPLDEVAVSVHKFLAICPPTNAYRLDALRTALGDRVATARSHVNYLEIGPAGVSKGEALLQLCSRLRIDPATVIAIGDSENDLPMLRAAGLGVAMGNADESVRRVADRVTGTNGSGGAADAILQYAEEFWGIAAPQNNSAIRG